jgi:hypothetical protein
VQVTPRILQTAARTPVLTSSPTATVSVATSAGASSGNNTVYLTVHGNHQLSTEDLLELIRKVIRTKIGKAN